MKRLNLQTPLGKGLLMAILGLIAAGAVVLEEVPPDCTVVGIPARVVRQNGEKVLPLDQIHVPDPVAQEICRLEQRIKELEEKGIR